MFVHFDEPGHLAAELADRAELCGLSFQEIELIIGLPQGAFPRALPVLDKEREACLRRLSQLCALVLAMQQQSAARWFRLPIVSLGSFSPIELMTADVQAVSGLLERLREECRKGY